MQALVALVLLLAATEVGVRNWLVSPATNKELTPLGWVDEPLTPVVHSREGYSRNRRNHLGFVDEAPAETPPPRRVVVLGDS
jgi:hypothetical protein